MASDSKTGRPSAFTQELADLICERIADGESLRSICDNEGMPSKSMVFRWLAAEPLFRDQYAHARDTQAESYFDDIRDIADDGRNDWMEKKNSDGENIGWQENGEAIRRSQLRIDARKWMAGKLKPKKYGEKLDLNVAGHLQTMPEEQLDARLLELIGKAGIGVSSGGEGEKEKPE